MAKNHRSSGKRIDVTAAAARVSGQLVFEEGLVGVAQTDALQGQSYAIDTETVYDVPLVVGAVVGNQVLLSIDGLNTISVAARGTAIPAGSAYVGRVVGIPGNGLGGNPATPPPLTGFMSVKLAGGAYPA
jgi:predicted RecA/RadA family phage recombinase